MSKKQRNALGKGLSALLENAETDITSSGEIRSVGSVSMIAVNQIDVNPFQPRSEFDKQALEELTESIKIHGIIQPITVRKLGYDKYQLISGERRTRAAIQAGLDKLPAYVRIANDQQMLEMALIENIQRQDLNAIEIAISYKRLVDECNLKLEELGERVSKERSTVNNYLRLLKLPAEIQSGIKEGRVSMGHARAMINIENEDDQLALYQRIIEENLSVRRVEDIIRQSKDGNNTREKSPARFSFNVQSFKKKSKEIKNKTGVVLKVRPKSEDLADLVVSVRSEEELNKLIELIGQYEV